MFVPQPFPYQGSKRRLARRIVNFFPAGGLRLVEPFAGSAAVSLAAASIGRASLFVLNDLNTALIGLWHEIISAPDALADAYADLWYRQSGRERQFYDEVRAAFNATGRPDLFLYLLARCVKASIRYNGDGQFNQSPDNRRRGMVPSTMRAQIHGTAQLLAGRVALSSLDYREVLERTAPGDIVYMDPPYQGVSGDRDARYIGGVRFEDFADSLAELNRRGIDFVVSYDGRTGDRRIGRRLPDQLGLLHLELDAGPSTQATLLGTRATTYEALYLSPGLAPQVGELAAVEPARQERQLTLFGG